MPGSKIGKSDVFNEDFFSAAKDAVKIFKELGKEARAFSKAVKDSKGFTEYTNNVKKATDATTRFAKSEQKLVKTLIAARNASSEEGKQQAIATEQKRRATKAAREQAKAQLGAEKATHRLTKAIALGNLIAKAAALVWRSFVRAIRQSVDIVKSFDKSTARLASVVGKTRDEIADLTKQAKELGSVTQFTATQVTSLQIELAKLGFEANEIKAATPSILSFATATGANLAEAAKTAGAAVRVFGLNASETEDAVATLAVATTKSGLTFEAFDTILSTVGPVAKAYGFTLEDVVALTGELATAGFEANKAATATRNILLNLADANGALAKRLGGSVDSFDGLIDAMVKLDEEGIDLGETLELTDKRSVAAFSRFLEGAESARTLRDGISGVNDELQEMVDVQLDTLAGDIDLLKSAWEGFILSLSSDGGLLRQAVQLLTNAVLQAQNLDLAVRKFHKQNAEQITRSIDLLESLTNKQGTAFSDLTAALADETALQLQSRRDDIIFHLGEIRKINKKEAVALFNELVRQRQEQEEVELKALIEKNDRLLEEERKTGKKRVVVFEDVSEQLKQLKKDEIATFEDEDQEYIEAYKNAWDLIEDSTEDAIDHIEGLLQVRSDDEIERLKTEQELRDEILQKQIEDEEKLRDTKIEIANQVSSFLGALSDRRVAKLEAEAEAGIISEKKLAEEKAKIARRQAVLKKAQSIFNITVDTASAVVEALPNIPLAIAIGVLGLASAATVIAEPIPQFEKGTKSSPKGIAVVGENGPELMIHNGHVGLSPGEASFTDLKKGTQIIPADITRELLKYSAVASAMPDAGDNMIVMMMDKLDNVERAIKSKPVASSIITTAGILTATHKGHTTIKELDRFFK